MLTVLKEIIMTWKEFIFQTVSCETQGIHELSGAVSLLCVSE